MATEYIEKQAAIKELCEAYEHEYPTASGAFDEYATRIVPNVLRNLPPADVRPVRRGRWVRINKYDKESNVKCPSCNEEFSYIDGVCYLVVGHELPLFCPNCGADMMGGDAE